MNTSKDTKTYSLISATCFSILGLVNIIIQIYFLINIDNYSLSFPKIFTILIAFAFAVLLFTRKNNTGLLIVAGVNIALNIYYVIHGLFTNIVLGFLVNYILEYFVSIVLFIIILFNVLPSMRKNAKFTMAIWFIPAALYLIITIIYLITCYSEPRYLKLILFSSFKYTWISWLELFTYIFEIAGLFFIGFWLREETKIILGISSNVSKTNQNTSFNYQANTIIGSADKIKSYKKLLDSGIITQEEFDEKKKQILDMY